MLPANKVTVPYSQYEVDQSEKKSVSSGSSSSVSVSNVAISEKLLYTDRQMNQEENQKAQPKRSKRNSFRRIFSQNDKEEKDDKKVKEKKTRSLSIFSKDKSGKNDKNEKHERHENERLRPRNHSNSGEKRKNRLSYIFFSDEEVKKDDVTSRGSNSSGSSSHSEDADGPQKHKNKPNTNRFSMNLDKFFGSEEDHKKNPSTNHNNLSDLFIPGNETPIKSHNRFRLINDKSLVDSPTSIIKPVFLESNTAFLDNTNDTDSKENGRHHIDNNTNNDSSHHESISIPGDYESNQSNPKVIINHLVHQDDTEITNDAVSHQNDTEVTVENHQDYEIINDSANRDYTGIINEGISHQNDSETISVDTNDQDFHWISSNDKSDEIVSGEKNHQNDAEITIGRQVYAEVPNHQNDSEITENHQNDAEITVNHQNDTEITENHQNDDEITENHQDDSEITVNHQNDTEIIENHQNDAEIIENHQNDAEITENHQNDTEIIENHQNDIGIIVNYQNDTGIIVNHQNDAEITENHQIDTKVTDYDHDYVKIIKDGTYQGYTEISNVNAGHQDYNNLNIKITSEDARPNENENKRTQKIRDETNDIHIHSNYLVSPNHHDGSPESPLSIIHSDATKSMAINPESDIENDYQGKDEERGIRVIEKNRFHEVRKIVERYQVPKIIEKHVIVTKDNPQTRQKLEQLQVKNESLISVNNQLESKVKEQSQQIAKLSSLESVMVRQVQLVERMEETIRRLETQVQDQKDELDVKISGHMDDTVRQLEYKLNEKSKELNDLRTMVMDQLQPQTQLLYSIPVQMVRTIDTNGLLPVSEKPSTDTTTVTAMTMAMTTRQEPQEIYSKNTLVNTLVVKPLVNTIVVSAGIATSVLYAVYIRPVVGLVKVVKSRM